MYVGRGKNGEIITGGKDGIIQIWNSDFSNMISSISAHGWRAGNLLICEGSEIDGLYYTGGKDGSICIWKNK